MAGVWPQRVVSTPAVWRRTATPASSVDETSPYPNPSSHSSTHPTECGTERSVHDLSTFARDLANMAGEVRRRVESEEREDQRRRLRLVTSSCSRTGGQVSEAGPESEKARVIVAALQEGKPRWWYSAGGNPKLLSSDELNRISTAVTSRQRVQCP
eukprot:Hpha_TRINITY_DN10648_c0_g1::TRINITY_DN10648_c0_g1_i2::g.156991::m.156991